MKYNGKHLFLKTIKMIFTIKDRLIFDKTKDGEIQEINLEEE